MYNDTTAINQTNIKYKFTTLQLEELYQIRNDWVIKYGTDSRPTLTSDILVSPNTAELKMRNCVRIF